MFDTAISQNFKEKIFIFYMYINELKKIINKFCWHFLCNFGGKEHLDLEKQYYAKKWMYLTQLCLKCISCNVDGVNAVGRVP